MRNPLGLRFSTGHALLASALAPPCIIAFLETRYWWAGIALASLGVIVATVTFYGRRITGGVAAVYVHNVIGTPRHRQLPIRRVSPPEESRYQMALPK